MNPLISKYPVINLRGGDAISPLRQSFFEAALKQAARTTHNYYHPIPSQASSVDEEKTNFTKEMLSPIRNYFSKRGYGPQNQDLDTDSFLLCTGGVSGGFSAIMQLLESDVRKNAPHLSPAIIMPVPNYTWFEDEIKARGHEIIRVRTKMNEGITVASLQEAFKAAEKKNLYVTAFFDSNPNNPTGHVRGEVHTKALAECIQNYNAQRHRLNGNWNGPASRVRIIDDMVYDGLQLNPDNKPFSFGQIPECFNDVFVLQGISKVGAANWRAAVMVCNTQDTLSLYMQQRRGPYCAPLASSWALHFWFNEDDPGTVWAKQRVEHLQEQRDHYSKASLLVYTLINGADNLPKNTVSEQNLSEFSAILEGDLHIPSAKASQLLRSGVNGITTCPPEAGFFMMLNFQGLKGQQYSDSEGVLRTIQREKDIDDLLRLNGIPMLPGTYLGYEGEDLHMRMTIGTLRMEQPQKAITALAEVGLRIHKMCDDLQPSQQNIVRHHFVPQIIK